MIKPGLTPSMDEVNEIVSNITSALENLRNSKILILGGTGFVGSWITWALLAANQQLNLGLKIHLGVRSLSRTREVYGNIKEGSLFFHDVTSLDELRNMDVLIHAATPSNPRTGALSDQSVLDATRDSTFKLMQVAKRSDAPVFMHLSSGIVYGELRERAGVILESTTINRNPLSAYAVAKFEAEKAVEDATGLQIVRGCNPRLFSFAGPLVDISGHYAIGDFLRQGIEGSQIVVTGNRKSTRSYMYPTDLVEWLIQCVVKPSLEPTHIGSNLGSSLDEIADSVASEFNTSVIYSASIPDPPSHYVPDCANTMLRLGVDLRISTKEAINRWRKWLESEPGRRVV